MEVKIFKGNNTSNVEMQVNEFIKDKKVLKILQTESILNDSKGWNLTITVIYEKGKAGNAGMKSVNSDIFKGLEDLDDSGIEIEILGRDTY